MSVNLRPFGVGSDFGPHRVRKGSYKMTYLQVTQTATIEVLDNKGLLAAWQQYGGPGSLVGRFITRKPLTDAQLRRLPAGLRSRLG